MGVEGHGFGDPDCAGVSVSCSVRPAAPSEPGSRRNESAQSSGLRGRIHQFASLLIGTPVIDTYQFKLAVPGVHDSDHRTKR